MSKLRTAVEHKHSYYSTTCHGSYGESTGVFHISHSAMPSSLFLCCQTVRLAHTHSRAPFQRTFRICSLRNLTCPFLLTHKYGSKHSRSVTFCLQNIIFQNATIYKVSATTKWTKLNMSFHDSIIASSDRPLVG